MKVRFYTIYGYIYKMCSKNSLHLIVLLLIFSCSKEPQVKPDQSGFFIKFFGGVATDRVYAAEETPDGGFISIGTTDSYGKGSTDIYVFKTDPNGNKQWEHTFGGGGQDEGKDIELTPDGGYVFLGNYSQENGNSDLNLVKIDKEGNLQWAKTFGLYDRYETAYALKTTDDRGFLLIGTSISSVGTTDMFIVKTTEDGSKEWERNYGITGLQDDLGSVQVTKSGNLVWCGSEHRDRNGSVSGTSDMRVIMTKPEGYLLWDKNYGLGNTETGVDIQIIANGFIVVGTMLNTQTGNTDIYVVRLTNDGTELWNKSYGGARNEEGTSIFPTKDGGYIITGATESEGEGGKDIYLLKVNGSGQQEWSKTFGGRLDDIGITVRQTTDGGYMIAGTVTFENNAMICLIKTNNKGEIVSR